MGPNDAASQECDYAQCVFSFQRGRYCISSSRSGKAKDRNWKPKISADNLRTRMQSLLASGAGNHARVDKRPFPMQTARMIKAMSILVSSAVAAIAAGCANSEPGSATAQSAVAEQDYERLSGTWQLTRAVVNGRHVPANVLRNTVLITDRNTFRFPKASGVGTHPAGLFTVNPDTRPKQVDSIAEGGANAGQLTRGIYEILDANHKRACWGPRGGPRPTEFKSPSGSGRILQYWKKIGPVPPQ
jgi:uncharacterized protein (TIGR03067 family)